MAGMGLVRHLWAGRGGTGQLNVAPAAPGNAPGPDAGPVGDSLPPMLSEAELAEIRKGVRDGIRGPVLTKWCEQFLADRDELARRLQTAQATGESDLSPDKAQADRKAKRPRPSRPHTSR